MARKKLKRAATIAAGIGAAYLASQALGKKKPVKKTSSLARRKGDTFGASTAQEIEASRPRDTFESDTAATYENVPAETFLKTPGGFPKISPATPEQADEMMQGFGPMAKKGKFISKKAKDMSKKHEGMESKADERKEYAMEEKGYKETSSGKMKKMMYGGSVVARGNKLARSKPTKLF